jgi:cyclophilin family peptidyl-prolyl cis-trans isomerase/HEAT repeat protein
MFARPSLRFRTRCVCSAALAVGATLLAGGRAAAQDPAIVEVLATVLQAEDSRQYNGPLLTAAARHADPLVRSVAALAIGRIGDPAGVDLLLEMLQDPDSTVERDAAFALGLLRDRAAIPTLRELVINTPPERQLDVHAEAVTALAKMGGPEVGAVFRELLGPWVARAATAAPPRTVESAVSEAWRLGTEAPIEQLVEFTVSPLRDAKVGAVYSLARLRPPEAADVLLAATDNPDPEIRGYAIRALTATYADSAGLDRTALAARVRRLVSDDDAHVRTNALRTLATYRDSTLAGAARDRLSDGDPNVRVAAVTTLGDLGGSAAAEALRDQVGRQPFAVRREALLGLARVEGTAALDVVAEWLRNSDWLYRSVGAEALGHVADDTVVPWLTYLTQDSDPRVAAVALASLTAVGPDTATVWARQLITHRDAVVRTIAADRLGAAANPADIGRLVAGYRLALRDSIPDARVAIVGALGHIAERGFSERIAVEDKFLAAFPTCADYLVRRAAAERFPEAARRWGPVTPVVTGRGLEDYRDIARRFVAPGAHGSQTIVIDSDRGRITIDLFAQDAPITVNAFLQLVDQRIFDGGLWHRVVPNFVIQDGDPRGDGWGGPGFALRDEINRNRYDRGTVGMALSGPDTGGSQFFITHSPQPHLDGTYTVIGRVISGMDVVDQITQDDRIRTVRRF